MIGFDYFLIKRNLNSRQLVGKVEELNMAFKVSIY